MNERELFIADCMWFSLLVVGWITFVIFTRKRIAKMETEMVAELMRLLEKNERKHDS